MAEQFHMPDPGEGVHEVRITEVHVEKGDKVTDGETLFSIESDKAAVDVPAPFDGTIEDVRVSDGDAVNVGDVLLSYSRADDDGQADETASSSDDAADADTAEGSETTGADGESGHRKGAQQAQPDEPKEARGQSDDQSSAEERGGTEANEAESPSEGAHESGGKADSDDASESSADGEKRRDTTSTDEAEPKAGKSESSRARDQAAEQRTTGDRKRKQATGKAAPSTRRLARQLGVDLQNVEPSGPQGRVLAADVEAVADRRARETQSGETDRQNHGRAQRQQPAAERVPLKGIRKITAQRMSEAWSSIPHVTHRDIVDITELERFRREHKDSVEAEGGKLTITVLAIKSLAAALRAFPRFNACLDADNDQIVLKYRYHIGFAVATDDGLLVPVLRHADRKSVLELAVEAADLAERARARDLRPSELRGSTFTLTNPGSIGGTGFTPIINPPQAAILGLGRARPEVAVTGDLDSYRLAPRLMLPLMLAFDHRLNDGADAARFVAHLTTTLADPEQFALRA